MTTFRAIDFETTGLPDEQDPHAVVEVGYCDLVDGRIDTPASMLCNPGRPIDVEAMAVHHIRDVDLVGALSPDQVLPKLMQRGDFFVAHNFDFEKHFFGGGGVPWIDTYKTALRCWPDAPAHSNQALRYYLKLDDKPDFDRKFAMPPHRAAPDAYVTAFVLRELLTRFESEKLVQLSSGPALLVRVGFGKHFGMRWADVPKDYLDWIVHKSDIRDRDVRATAKFYLRSQPKGERHAS